MTPLRIYTIGRVSPTCFVILRQDWETYFDGGHPIWVREGSNTFIDLRVARTYLHATANLTTDAVVAGCVEPAKPYSIREGAWRFAELAKVHEYLVRN